jgi:hypothetical protein
MSLLEAKGEPLTPQSPSFSLEICSLPAQLQIYEWYIVLAIMTFFNIAHAAWKWRTRIRSYQAVTGAVSIQYRSFSMYFLGKAKELLVVVLSFYATILLFTYYF